MKRKFKLWWSTIPPISQQTLTSHLQSLNTKTKKRPWHTMLEIQVMSWDRHANMAGSNRYHIWLRNLELKVRQQKHEYHRIKRRSISNLVRTRRFWNNLHQVRSISKYCKAKQFKRVWGAIKPKGLNLIAKIG